MAVQRKLISPVDYLALERQAAHKSEYFAGQLLAMAGGSQHHSLVASNVLAELHAQLRQSPCRVYNSDMKVYSPRASAYHYPDLAIVCEAPRFADAQEDVLLNPLVLVEILSPSTAAYDCGKKFQLYQEIESLREYLLVAQDEAVIERFSKQPSGAWLYTKAEGLDATLLLETIRCQLALQDVYAKVDLPRD